MTAIGNQPGVRIGRTAMTVAECVIDPSPIAQDRFKMLVQIFWRQVIASATDGLMVAGKTKESDRGVAKLREHIKSDLDPRLAILEQLRIASEFSPSAQRHEEEEITRVKRFIAAAPKCCWFAAADWIDRDFEGANQFLALAGPDLQDVGFLHLLMVTGTQLHRLTGGPATMSQWAPDRVETMICSARNLMKPSAPRGSRNSIASRVRA